MCSVELRIPWVRTWSSPRVLSVGSLPNICRKTVLTAKRKMSQRFWIALEKDNNALQCGHSSRNHGPHQLLSQKMQLLGEQWCFLIHQRSSRLLQPEPCLLWVHHLASDIKLRAHLAENGGGFVLSPCSLRGACLRLSTIKFRNKAKQIVPPEYAPNVESVLVLLRERRVISESKHYKVHPELFLWHCLIDLISHLPWDGYSQSHLDCFFKIR